MIPPLCKVTAKNPIRTPHLVSPASCSDECGQWNVMNEEERAIPEEQKSSSLEDAASLALSELDVR